MKSVLAGLRPSRETWGETLKGIALVGGAPTVICVILVVIVCAAEGKVSAVAGELLLVFLAIAWSIGLLIGLASRYDEPTRQSTLAKIRERQEARRHQPRDLVALATVDLATRRRWYSVVRRRSRFASLPRLVLAIPIVAFFTAHAASPMYKLYHPLGWGLAAIGTLGGVGMISWSVRKRWGDPLLFVGQVEGVQHGFWKEGATKWIEYGRTRTVALEPRAVCRLCKDGTLQVHRVTAGRQTLGVRRAVARNLMHGEHCALICSGAGDVVYQCGALARKNR